MGKLLYFVQETTTGALVFWLAVVAANVLVAVALGVPVRDWLTTWPF